jgi:hypothetical protein
LTESTEWKWLYYQKQSTCSMQPLSKSNDIHHRDWKIYPKVHLVTQKTSNNQGNNEQKKKMLKVSQYLTSNYITKPSQ